MPDAAAEDAVVDKILTRDTAEDRLVCGRPREGEPNGAAAEVGHGDGIQRTAIGLRLAHQPQRCRMARMQEDVRHRPLLHDTTAIEHGDAVAGAADDVHLMGDEHDGDAELAVDLAQQVKHGARRLRVERARRLVAEQHLRLAGERPCDADALLLAAGKLAGIFVGVLGEPDAGEQRRHALGDLDLAKLTGEFQRIGDIAGDGARTQQVEMLEDHADRAAKLAQALALGVRHPHAAYEDLAARRALQKVDEAHQRRLAGPGGADDAEDLALGDREVDAVERGNRTILAGKAFGDALEPDHRRQPALAPMRH